MKLLIIYTILFGLALAMTACAGKDGKDGINGSKGAPGLIGPNGPVGPAGPSGIDGADGRDGQDGQNGTNGRNANVDTVQLCPGAVIYPSNFPEYGLCINDMLYGVYSSQAQAFLAALPPGLYSSTSTTTPCNFSVLPHCVAVPQ
jgi:hypothetical protein